jgi:hypothetical protein
MILFIQGLVYTGFCLFRVRFIQDSVYPGFGFDRFHCNSNNRFLSLYLLQNIHSMGIVVSNTYCVVILFCFSSSCVPYMLLDSLGCPFLIATFGIL